MVRMCAPARGRGQGWHGLWVALFVYSMLFELVDTALLLLAGRPDVVLQWCHRATVRVHHTSAATSGDEAHGAPSPSLRCCSTAGTAYSSASRRGMWFATMNSSLHAVMYGYDRVHARNRRPRARGAAVRDLHYSGAAAEMVV